jgi:hypothetical protein
MAVGEVAQGGLQVRIARPDEEDVAGPLRRHDRPGPVVGREQVWPLVRIRPVAGDEADLDRPDIGRHVVDDDVGLLLGVDVDRPALEEATVAPDLDLACGAERSRLATLTKTDPRLGADGAVQNASATIAWFRLPLSDRRPKDPDGGVDVGRQA